MDIGSRRGMSAGDGPGRVCPCPAGRAAAGRPGAACRADADGRPVGVHRPRGRRRQGRSARPGQGVSRAAQVQGRRPGEEGPGRLHHRAASPIRRRSTRRSPSAMPPRPRSPTPISSCSAPRSSCAPTPAPWRSYDQRLSEQLQAKAQLEDAKAQLRDAEIQLSYTEIKSPIDGRIGRAAVSPGNIVGPDIGVLATVVQREPDPRAVPRDPARAAGGQARRQRPAIRRPCACSWPTAASTRRRASIDFIDVTVDPKTDGQIVRAMFDNKDDMLTDGQTVRVILEDNKRQERGDRCRRPPSPSTRPAPTSSSSTTRTWCEQRRVKTGVARERPAGRHRGAESRRARSSCRASSASGRA